jgi:DNA-binding MarR family transcriptional regulator
MILFNTGDTRINVISRELRVAPPTATGIVNRLQASGYVIRRADPKDGRSVVIDLTAEGRALALKLKAVVVRRWTGLLSKISRQDAEKYLEILKKISEAL